MMPKLKTYGVPTEEEYRQAERDGKFLITDNVTCSYCHAAVTIHDTQFLYCKRHYQLALSMYWYPGYPGVPMDAPRYKQMHFFLSQLERNRPLFDRQQPEYIAREKGCPFCSRYLVPVSPRIEGQRDASLLNKKMFCPDCGVAFLIEVIARTVGGKEVLQMHFTPDAASIRHITEDAEIQTQHDGELTHADNNVEHAHDDATQTDTDTDTRANETQNTEKRPAHRPGNPPVNLPLNLPNPSDDFIDEHPNPHTDIAGQIVAFLTDAPDNTATTGEMIAAFNCTTQGFNKARKKLIKDGVIRKVQRGVYQLINP